MRKRQKLVLSALLLSAGLVGVHSAPLEWRYGLTGLLAGVTWLLTVWSLREGLSGIEWVMVTMPSVLFTAAVGLFYVLLPQSWWAKMIIVIMFGIGQYALLLTANIFSVAAIRTIALFRAASAVGFVMELLTGFLLFDTIFSFRLDFWLVGILVAITSCLLLMPAIWSVELEEKLSKRVVMYSGYLGLAMGFLSLSITFWPISIAVSSLFLSTIMYTFLGVTQHHFSQRLFKKTVYEYVSVGVVVLVTMLITSGLGV